MQRLLVKYSPPLSNGGEGITSYLVELDPTPTFDDPITESFRCPNSPDYATWVIASASNSTINSGCVSGQCGANSFEICRADART